MRWQVKVDAGRYLRVIRHPAARLPPPLLPTSHHPPAGWFGLRSTRLQQILCLRKSVLLLLQLSCAFNLLTANQPNWEISSILTSWTISRKSMSACPHNISTESKGFLLGGGRVGWGLNSADCTPSYWPCDYSIVLITNIPVPTVSSDNCRHASCFTQMLLSNVRKCATDDDVIDQLLMTELRDCLSPRIDHWRSAQRLCQLVVRARACG